MDLFQLRRISEQAGILLPSLLIAWMDDKVDEAVRLIRLRYRLADYLSATQFKGAQLVRFGMISSANHMLRTMLPDLALSDEHVRTLDAEIVKIEAGIRLAPSLMNERAYAAEVFERRKALDRNLHFFLETARTPASGVFAKGMDAIEMQWINILGSPFGLPIRRNAAATTLSVPDDVLQLLDEPPPWPAEAQRRYDAWKWAFNIDRVLLEPGDASGLDSLRITAIRVRRQLAMMRLALRLKRFEVAHGRLPERLEEVCEQAMPEMPLKWFEGRPLRYTKADRSFQIEAEPSALDEVYASSLSREDIRVTWGLALNMDFGEPMGGKKAGDGRRR